MKKLKWELHRQQLADLTELVEDSLVDMEPKNIAEKWIRYELRNLAARLAKLKWTTGSKVKLNMPPPECFAFVAFFSNHPIDPTNHTDNLLLKMINEINQRYA